MLWDEAEATIRAYIEAQWAAGAYASIPLVFENELADDSSAYMLVNIEGVDPPPVKTIYGSTGKRASVEEGLVHVHSFGPAHGGKTAVLAPVVALIGLLELRTLADGLNIEGANSPSPIAGDPLLPA